jgi:hypothetical protein
VKSKIISLVLLIFVVASLGFIIINGNESGVEGTSTVESVDPTEINENAIRTTDVIYFYSTVRCPTCKKLESYTHETIEADFASQLENGDVNWRMINIDEPENEHYIQDYQLVTKSVVLVEMADDQQVRWKNLDQIWELVGDKDVFQNYIKEETNKFIGIQG